MSHHSVVISDNFEGTVRSSLLFPLALLYIRFSVGVEVWLDQTLFISLLCGCLSGLTKATEIGCSLDNE
jgi:hypothetical protein